MKRSKYFVIPVVLLVTMFLAKPLRAAGENASTPSNKEIAQKTQKLHMPFIANEGQVDERVAFYAKTFGGTVFVTKDGDIVYSLPKFNETAKEDRNCRKLRNIAESGVTKQPSLVNPQSTTVALREEFIGAKVSGIKGEGESITKVSYFKGNDPSKWKSNISTYELVNLGEIYDGIELKLKAHGNNVEKLLYVKPGADLNQIKISLSGLQPSENPLPLSPSVRGTGGCPPLAGAGGGLGAECGLGARGLSVNEEGELEAETALGTVKFTKPIAYQEIDGKRVEVETAYVIRDREVLSVGGLKNTDTDNGHAQRLQVPDTDNGHASRTYSFTVASYDKSHDLIVDPLLASTYLGGSNYEWGHSLALDTSGNVYVMGDTSA